MRIPAKGAREMKSRWMVCWVVIGAALATSVAVAQSPRPKPVYKMGPTPKSYQMKLDAVALLQATNGARALLQFTNFAGGASYRYRYLPPGGGTEQRGGGKVWETSEPVKMPDGSTRTRYRPDHCQVVVGDISFPWSAGSPTMGWIYVVPQRVRVEILGATAFDRPW
jgi:hypothetical protein